jgi:hypothetical protein
MELSSNPKGPFIRFSSEQSGLLELFKSSSGNLSKKDALDVLRSLARELDYDLVPSGQVKVSSVIASMSAQSRKDSIRINKKKSLDNARPKVKNVHKIIKEPNPLWIEFSKDEGKDLIKNRDELKSKYGNSATVEQKSEISQASAAVRAAYGIFCNSRANSSAKVEEPAQTS